MSQSVASFSSQHDLGRATGLLLILNTPKAHDPGRGVFSSRPIKKGTTIEVSPVLIFTEDEVELHTSKTCLQHYTYYWPTSDGRATTQAIALGLGSMFNHSRNRQNVVWSRNVEAQCIVYTAHRDIEAGEELCISYGNARLWFEDADGPNEDDDYFRIRVKKSHDDLEAEIELSGLARIDL